MNAMALTDYIKQSIQKGDEITLQGLVAFEKANPKYIKHKQGYYWDCWVSDQTVLNEEMLAE